MFVSKLNDGVEAKSFAWLADDTFVTEFYGPKLRLYTHWNAPAVFTDVSGKPRVDNEELKKFHDRNCALFEEQGGAEKYKELGRDYD